MKKTITTSLLFIALLLCMSIGGTYALFSSSSDINVAITAATIAVKATITDVNLTSFGEVQPTNFANGGTCSVEGSTLTLSNITPGDQVSFMLNIENKSSVNILYRVSTVTSGELAQYLSFTPITINWTKVEPNKTITPIKCVILLPSTVADEAQGLSCKIAIKVEAVQGNADTTVLAIPFKNDEFDSVLNAL